jgi:NADH dehydrogenase
LAIDDMNALQAGPEMADAGQTCPVGRSGRPSVVIVGAGFGGLMAAKTLAGAKADVTIIDKHNYHLFQPLLYQVATAALSPAQIAAPIRSILRDQSNVNVRLGRVTGVDAGAKQVELGSERLSYDWLILATGARHAYFGHDEWEAFAPGLKKIEDATAIRRRILMAFEEAENMVAGAERSRLLNFVIVGGGPTGVEMAGAIAELARRALASDFRMVDPRLARIILVQSGSRLLPAFDPSLSDAALHSLGELGVEVRLDARVTACDCSGVSIGQERIESRTIMWAAGVMASPAGDWLGADLDHAGRVKVAADLSVPEHPHIFVIGDTARACGRDGQPLPGVAPVAKQQGQYVAKLLAARAKGRTVAPFRYRDFGAMATIGRKRAVAQLGRLKLSGFVAWTLWSVAHIYFLIGFRNRLVVAMNWAWYYVTFQRGTRLITGISGSRIEDVPHKDEITDAIPASMVG